MSHQSTKSIWEKSEGLLKFLGVVIAALISGYFGGNTRSYEKYIQMIDSGYSTSIVINKHNNPPYNESTLYFSAEPGQPVQLYFEPLLMSANLTRSHAESRAVKLFIDKVSTPYQDPASAQPLLIPNQDALRFRPIQTQLNFQGDYQGKLHFIKVRWDRPIKDDDIYLFKILVLVGHTKAGAIP
ncbi:MAG: hypothetical protein OXT67_14090 [Zetaproteobacteria bacterium]|nr:hypothetical protein [Zetaproteobacteria bacterium]